MDNCSGLLIFGLKILGMDNRVYVDNVGWCVRLVHYRLGEGGGLWRVMLVICWLGDLCTIKWL